MSFWGVEVKPGKPVTHSFDRNRGRLRISQATLGIGTVGKRSLVQCNVGNKSPVFLCALLPEKTESCHLDLEFEEEDDVVFSVLGPRSVHLTGYYVSKSSRTGAGSDTESFGEDIANTDTEVSNRGSDEDEYDNSFIDDAEPEVFSSLSDSSDEDAVVNRKSNRKKLKKRHQVIVSDDDASHESQDEDNCNLSDLWSRSKNKTAAIEKSGKATVEVTGQAELGGSGKDGKDEKVDTKMSDNCEDKLVSDRNDTKLVPENDAEPAKSVKASKKRKNKSEVDISKKEKFNKSDTEHNVPMGIESSVNELSEDGPKLKKRKKGREVELNECKDSSPGDAVKQVKQEVKGADISTDLQATEEDKLQTSTQNIDVSSEKKREKKKKKKNKVEDERTNSMPEPDLSDKGLNVESSRVRTLSNGLVIEDLTTGEVDGKVATSGKKVKVYYTGVLKESGRVFDSNIGKTPFKFRLGDKEVINGWNIGLEGMHVGDKRRLTVPPAMGYGGQGGGENIPPNSWLVYEIEMVGIRK